uniref:Acetylglutamate kinase n=1 Tax=Ptilothamnion sphaericum TaxID=1498216 RepID=A0A4D6X036_9FLOR|nr:acetylglutamate kinase [Ptilothamnion sphaericum]
MLFKNSDRIKVLNEIIPLISDYSGSIFVVKYGGAAMTDNSFVNGFVQDILLLYNLGIKIVIVHGGGPLINDWLNKLNIVPKFNNGLRVTDRKTMEVVEMVLCGKVNKYLVALFNRNSPIAVGLSGKDASLIIGEPIFSCSENFVAEVKQINSEVLDILLSNNYIPVIASTACNIKGDTYNINADIAAGSIASSLKAQKLFLLTDTPGIMYDVLDDSSIINNISCTQIDLLKEKDIIKGGMIPKVNSCVSALYNGVRSAYIINGKLQHSLLYELFTDYKTGTKIDL